VSNVPERYEASPSAPGPREVAVAIPLEGSAEPMAAEARAAAGEAATAVHYFRFGLFHRLLHGGVVVSFLGLVATGMPLRFSDAAWAARLARSLGGFEAAGYFHRVFAILLCTVFALYVSEVAYRVFVGKETGLLWGPTSMVPQPRDFLEMLHHFRWFLGLGPRPRFDRFTYWEKFDYWAVFWGMAIIGGSGFVLWFPTAFARVFPGWLFNVATVIHGEEALLAALFIFSVHFFNSHFRPEKFPADLVIFTGRVSQAELREERPAEYERLRDEGELEALRADAPPRWMRNFARLLAFTSLAIGLTLMALIVYALVR
jgi:cytochrome b subunit of formate dehydrogenase